MPKKDNPQKIGDYTPISLSDCMYKVLAKLLANKIQKVIKKVGSEFQMGFVQNCQILDGVVIANELVDDVRTSNKSTLLFIVDIKKAYDSVNWDFLQYMMRRMGFLTKWGGRISECLSTARVSILVNGSAMEEFSEG